MIELIHRLSLALSAVPILYRLAANSFAIWLAVYSVRRWLPGLWLRLEKLVPERLGVPLANILLTLPGAAFGAALAAPSTGLTPAAAYYGAITSVIAALFHHALKAAPVEYRGPLRDTAFHIVEKMKKEAIKRGALSGLFLLLIGCTPATDAKSAKDAREECYREAKRPYEDGVARCEEQGRNFAACGELTDLSELVRMKQEACK